MKMSKKQFESYVKKLTKEMLLEQRKYYRDGKQIHFGNKRTKLMKNEETNKVAKYVLKNLVSIYGSAKKLIPD